jgi:hypothetical protein
MAEGRTNGSSLCPRVASAIWGWRLELGIGMVTAVLLGIGHRLGLGGDVLMVGGVGISLWRFPHARRRILTMLRQASTRPQASMAR